MATPMVTSTMLLNVGQPKRSVPNTQPTCGHRKDARASQHISVLRLQPWLQSQTPHVGRRILPRPAAVLQHRWHLPRGPSRTENTATGISALSIWMNDTLRYRYAALPT